MVVQVIVDMFIGDVVDVAAMVAAAHWLSAGKPEKLNVTAAGNDVAPAVVGVTVSVAMAEPPGITDPVIVLSASIKLEPAVNMVALDVPPGVVTVTVWAPAVAAPAAMVNVAVIVVLFTTVIFEAVIPAPLKLIEVCAAVAPKPVPVSVTVPFVPSTPLFGLMEETVGTGRFTVNVTAEVVTPREVTVMLCAPSVAVAESANVAVIEPPPAATVRPFTVIPLPAGTLMVAGAKKLAPVSVTGTLAP
jgi:hypothetical protein